MRPYATIADVRDTGVTVSQASDAKIEDLLDLATERIEQLSAQVFTPVRATYAFGGQDHQTLMLGEPLISLERVVVSGNDAWTTTIDSSMLEVWNRDLTRGQLSSQDGGSPKMRVQGGYWGIYYDSEVWPLGDNNVEVTGVWGRVEARYGYLDTSPEPWVLVPGDDLHIQVDGAVDSDGAPEVQVVTLELGDLPDFGAVTADALSAALRGALGGVDVRRRVTEGGVVARLQSALRALSSRVHVVGGSAAPKLGLNESDEMYWPMGETPRRITEAAVRLVRMSLGLAPGASDGSSYGEPGPVKSHRTKSQEVTWAVDSGVNQQWSRGSLGTGDPVVDHILSVEFARPRPRVAVPQARRGTLRYPYS